MTANTSNRRYDRQYWFALHSWFALPVWGGLLLICLTGTLASISQELTWLFNPDVRASASTGHLQVDQIQTTIRINFPNATINDIRCDEPYLACRVRLIEHNAARRSVLVDPYTGVLQGEIDGIGFRGFILALHGWLLMPWQNDYSLGWYLVTLFSIPLLGSVITALLITKPFWRSLLRPRLRIHKGGRALWSDLHRLLGVWSIGFVALISLTGLWFLVQGVLSHNQVTLYPQAPTEQLNELFKTSQTEKPLSHFVEQAQRVYPDLHITHIDLPNNHGELVAIQGKRSGSLFRANANTVHLSPASGQVIAANSPSNIALLSAVVALITPLHFGDFAGLTSKLIWFVFGCGLCALIISGFVIWAQRTRHLRQPNQRRRATTKRKDRLTPSGRREWLWLSWWLILLPITGLLLLLT